MELFPLSSLSTFNRFRLEVIFMKKMTLGSSMLISGVIGFSVWQTSAASTASACVYLALAVIGLMLALSPLRKTNIFTLQTPHSTRGRTGFDGGSEAGIAGRGAWPR